MKSYKFLKIWDVLHILNQNEHTLLDKTQYCLQCITGEKLSPHCFCWCILNPGETVYGLVYFSEIHCMAQAEGILRDGISPADGTV